MGKSSRNTPTTEILVELGVKLTSFLFLFFILVSCAQRIKVPINRFLNPEAIGGGIQVEYQDTGLSSGILNFEDNSSSNPLSLTKIREESGYLGLSLSKKADLFFKIQNESSSLIGLKVQVLGGSFKEAILGNSLSFSLALGNERDTFDSTFQIRLRADVTDYSLIHGYRFSPNFIIYDGVSLSNYSFEGSIIGETSLDSNRLDYSARNILGAHIGAIYGSQSLNLKLELATQRIVWTNTDERLFYHLGFALSAGW